MGGSHTLFAVVELHGQPGVTVHIVAHLVRSAWRMGRPTGIAPPVAGGVNCGKVAMNNVLNVALDVVTIDDRVLTGARVGVLAGTSYCVSQDVIVQSLDAM
jgi:hypothetical protein